MTYKADFLIVFFGRLCVAVIALLSLRLVTTYLSPADFGQLSILISIQVFCGLFLVNPAGQYINIHTHQWWSDHTLFQRLKRYRIYIYIVSATGSVITYLLAHYYEIDPWLGGGAIFFIILFGTWNSTLLPMLNMLGFRGASITLTISSAALGLVASILLVRNDGGATGWFIGQSIGLALGAMLAIIFFKKHAPPIKDDHRKIKLISNSKIISYCFPLAVATGFMWCQLSGYRFIVDHYWGITALGFLSAGLLIPAQISGLFESLVMQFLYPYFYSKVSGEYSQEGLRSSMSDLLNVVFPIYIVFSGSVIIAAPYLTALLLGPQYQDQSYFFVVGVLVELFRMLANILGNAAHVRRESALLTIPYGLGAAATLGAFIFMGTRNVQINLAVLSMIASGALMFFIMYRVVAKEVKFCIKFSGMFISTLFLIATLMATNLMPAPEGLGHSIGMIFLIGAIVLTGIYLFLRSNDDLKRLLNTQLRSS